MTYFHPRDFDAEQPKLSGLSPLRRFKSYVGIKGAKRKLASLLSVYSFMDVKEAEENIDWTSVPQTALKTGTSI